MSRKELKNKPLVEAILEIKWHLETCMSMQVQGAAQAIVPAIDPHYKLLLGRMFDRLEKQYPVHEQLPTASMPDEVVGHTVQHRFRTRENGWPLVQIGPGIFTVNDTDKYTWTDFERRAREGITTLFDAHPNVSELRIQSIVLRYIDAVEFDYSKENVFEFLRDKLKVGLVLPESLFDNTGVDGLPTGSQWQATFACTQPRGMVQISFTTGQKNDKPAILWGTTVQSSGSDLPDMPDGFPEWVEQAHDIADDWFFKLIEGDLERRFESE